MRPLGVTGLSRRGRHLVLTWPIALLGISCSQPTPPGPTEYLSLVEWAEYAVVEGLGAATEPEPPIAIDSGQGLFLAAGTTTSMALFTPGEAELRIASVATRGGAQLEIAIETEAGPFSTTAVDGASRDPLRLELPEETPIRILMTVTGRSVPGERAGVALTMPSIWGAREEQLGLSAGSQASLEPVGAPVIIYLIDTLRRDRLGCYGYPKPITPEIDAFAARATLFEDAVGQSSWTKASVASTFTGVWPPAHGAFGWKTRLPEEFDTLAEVLERAGYATAAFSTNPNITPLMGFDQGFEEFSVLGRIRSAELNDLVFEWLGRVPAGRPPFLYVQPIDPHSAYDPPPEFLDRHAPGVDPKLYVWREGEGNAKWPVEALADLEALYDGEVAANDASFGALVDELERLGLYESALIVLTSDHGEEFQEHGGWRHGNHLYAEGLDVPLIVKFPGQTEGRRVTGPAQHIDILPTILDAVGLTIPEAVEGKSLGRDGAGTVGRRAYSHLELRRPIPHLTVVDGDWKLMQRRREDGTDTFLFNRRGDRWEQRNLLSEFPVRAAAMIALLDMRLAATSDSASADSVEIDAELERELRALGYL